MTWKLNGMILKVLVLMVGYSGTMLGANSSYIVCDEVIAHQNVRFEERYTMDTFFRNPDERTFALLMERYEQTDVEEIEEGESGEESEGTETSPISEQVITPMPSATPEASPTSSPQQGEVQTPATLQFQNGLKEITDAVLKSCPLKQPYGLYVLELKTGYAYGVNENLTQFDEYDKNTDGYFRAASVVKLQMAYAAYRLIEQGELEADKTWTDPVTKRKIILLPALHSMVSRSDNDLFNTMLRCIGKEKVNQTLVANGIVTSRVYGEINPAIGYSSEGNLLRHGTTKVGGKITPKEMGVILKTVYIEKDSNPYMGYFNEALLANIYNSRIPRGIGKQYPVAHKTGTSDYYGVYNDAGIVYCKNPYVLVVLTKGESATSAESFIRLIAKNITAYMDTRADQG